MAVQKEFIDPVVIPDWSRGDWTSGFTQVVTVKDRGVKTIYVSGQVRQGEDLRGDVEGAFQGVVSRLESAGATVDDVVKIRIYVKNFRPDDYPVVSEARLQTFNEGRWPTSTMLGVQSLYSEPLRVEIEAIAVVPDPAAGAGPLEKEYIGPSRGFHQTVSVKSGGLKTIYVSGQVGEGGDLAAQTASVYQALAERLEAAGASMTDLVKANTYITDFNPQRDMAAFREARFKVFTGGDLPASTLIGVQSLAADRFKVEVDAIAVVADEGSPAPQKQFIDPAQGFTQVVTAKGSGAKTIYISGQVGRPGDELAAQADQVYGNLKKRLEAAGASPADLLKVIMYIANYTPGDADVLGAAMAKHGFPQENFAAATLIGITSLFSETALIEVEGIAVIEG
jgi:enamine deaminase RidA (YjgF/YER057c/UK114 family)